MDYKQHLLICLAEECGELIQRTTKALRFGLNDSHPKYNYPTNTAGIEDELNDLYGVLELLNEYKVINISPDRTKINIKKKKVLKYMEYSKDRQQLDNLPDKLEKSNG